MWFVVKRCHNLVCRGLNGRYPEPKNKTEPIGSVLFERLTIVPDYSGTQSVGVLNESRIIYGMGSLRLTWLGGIGDSNHFL